MNIAGNVKMAVMKSTAHKYNNIKTKQRNITLKQAIDDTLEYDQ